MCECLDFWDFDGTLLRTPTRADAEARLHTDFRFIGSWWTRPESLSKACIPDAQAIVNGRSALEFLASKTDPSKITVISTGRKGHLARRVTELLLEADLLSEESEIAKNPCNNGVALFFKPQFSFSTFNYKSNLLFNLAKEYNPQYIRVFEDRIDQAAMFAEFCSNKRLNVSVYDVHADGEYNLHK